MWEANSTAASQEADLGLLQYTPLTAPGFCEWLCLLGCFWYTPAAVLHAEAWTEDHNDGRSPNHSPI